MPLPLIVLMGVAAVGVAVVVVARRRPYARHPDLFFAGGLIVAVIGVALMPLLGWGSALLTAAGGAMMLVEARRMFAGW
jgi:hypothetical protein